MRAVYRSISGFLLQKAGFTRTTGHPGAVTLIQRFGSGLNLNIHFHMIFLDRVYPPVIGAATVFRQVPAPTGAELQELVQRIAARTGKVLEKRGLVERDMENAWLVMQGVGGPLDEEIGHSITYRGEVGPRARARSCSRCGAFRAERWSLSSRAMGVVRPRQVDCRCMQVWTFNRTGRL